MNKKNFFNNTRLVHHLYDPWSHYGFINPPVFRGSTVLFTDAETMERGKQAYTYGKTVLVPSGLAGITVALLGTLFAGDHLLMIDTVYHPTRCFANNMLKNLGIEVEYYRPGAVLEKLLRSNTRVVFAESPGSNTFEMSDISAMVVAAHRIGALVMMDNTWATPLYFRPLDHGVDISIQAATKYLAGHSDVLLGTISANEKYAHLIDNAHRLLGMSVPGEDVYLTLRGLRTLNLRLEHQQKTALALARWLETCPEIDKVLYPALESSPGHQLWKRDFTGASAIFSIVLKKGGKREAYSFLDHLKLFGLGYSWGGFESLAVHVNLADRTVSRTDYPGPVLRLQIGIEDFHDLKEDIITALQSIR